jgi:hypothetical protein
MPSPADDPTGPDTGDLRVLRGSSRIGFPYDSRSACRFTHYREFSFDTGFRVARTQ